jgi:tetratricopeptide (TPR) repeat protein
VTTLQKNALDSTMPKPNHRRVFGFDLRNRSLPATWMRWGATDVSPATGLSLLAALILLGTIAPALGQGWPVPNAAGRIRIERVAKSPWPAAAGVVDVCPCGLEATSCQVAVFTVAGRQVGARIGWAASGESLKVLFDTSSGEVTYDLYLCQGPPQTIPWQPEAGIVLETRQLKNGPVNTWDRAWRLYQTSEPVLGRSVVDEIFQGIAPHGPPSRFAGHYSGWFQTKTNGTYEFAVAATGPAFLRVDDKLVASRPATGGSRGRRGEFSGKLDLRPGHHHLDYLFFHPAAGDWLAEVGWKVPGGKPYFELMSKEAFLPVGRFRTFSWSSPPSQGGKAAFEWSMLGQSVINDQALVSVRCQTVGGRKDPNCRWQFDDGTVAEGSPVVHVFPRTGLRRVQLVIEGEGASSGRASEQIRVEPNWSQAEEWRDALFAEQKKQLMGASFAAMPARDLAALVKFADLVPDADLLTRLGPTCLQRAEEFSAAQADALFRLAHHLHSPGCRDYPAAEKVLRAAIKVASDDTSLKDRSKLQLAQLLTDAFNRPGEALTLLGTVRPDLLTSESQREASLLRGDALAALGRIDEALKAYHPTGEPARPADLLRSVQGAARLESARDLIRRGESDDAESILRQIEAESPLTRLSGETGVPMVRVHLARKEYLLARSRCQRLLQSASVDTDRADVLYYLAESELALNQTEAARDTLRSLAQQHPYSEAAARAKDRWPNLFPVAKK